MYSGAGPAIRARVSGTIALPPITLPLPVARQHPLGHVATEIKEWVLHPPCPDHENCRLPSTMALCVLALSPFPELGRIFGIQRVSGQ